MGVLQKRATTSLCSITSRAFKRNFKHAARALANVDGQSSGRERPNTSIDVQERRGSKSLKVHPLWNDIADQRQMKEFSPNSVKPTTVGTAYAFPDTAPNPHRIFGVPRSVEKEFNFLSKPYSVVRKSTVELVGLLDRSKEPGFSPRVVITGAPGSGKSFLLLQAISYCTSSQWIVLSIPRGIELVNCSTPYNYDPRTQTFLQPTLSATLLRQLKETNHPALKALTLTSPFSLEKAPSGAPEVGAPLVQLIDYGIRETSVTSFVLEAVLAELASQTTYPFLLAIDDFQALYCQSLYRSSQFLPIEGYHLSVPRLLMEYAGGWRQIENGALLGALSLYHTSFPVSTELYEALDLDLTHGKRPDSYSKRSDVLQHYAQGLQAFHTPSRLDIQEAAGIFDVWIKDRALHTSEHYFVNSGVSIRQLAPAHVVHLAPSDQLFLSKYCESDGNAKGFVWRGLMTTLDT